LRVLTFYGAKEERTELIQQLKNGKFDVVLTTFEMCLREKTELNKLKYEYLILDEAQRIKNEESVLSQVLRKFTTTHRVLLTGTPLQNNLNELWALLNFLMPSLFDSSEEFQELFQVQKTFGQD
jgi:SWI/SNF-related matrix-associated actin-dependent regulator of chromatin subfamily A member 5